MNDLNVVESQCHDLVVGGRADESYLMIGANWGCRCGVEGEEGKYKRELKKFEIKIFGFGL